MRHARIVVALVALAALSSCGGSGNASREEAERRSAAVRAEATRLFPVLTDAMVAVSSTSGRGRWTIRSMEPSPDGAEYVVELTVDQTDTGVSERTRAVEAALTDAGWSLEQGATSTVRSSRKGLDLTARVEGAGAFLSLTSGCLDLPGGVVDELTDRRSDELGLELGR